GSAQTWRTPLAALAVTHEEVERRADDHDHVRLVEGERARAIEVMRIAGRQEAACGAVEVSGDVEPAQQGNGVVVAAACPDLLAEKNRGTCRVHQDVGKTLDVRRITDRLGRGAVLPRVRHHTPGD